MSKDASDTVTDVQDKVLEAIKVGQEATLTAVRETADAFTSVWPKMPEWPGPESFTPKMPDFRALPSLETLIGFTEKIWENQREFNMKLYEAIAPFGRSAFDSAKDAAKGAGKETVKTGESAKTAEHTARSAAAKA